MKRIANRFKVSPAVIWYRLMQTKTITQDVFNNGWGQWSGWRPPPEDGGGGSSTARNIVRDLGVALPDLLLRASKKGLLNETDVTQYLGVSHEFLPSIEQEVASHLTR